MIPAQAISQAILTVAPGLELNGVAMPPIAKAIGQAVSEWLGTVTVQGNAAGTAGVGVVSGIFKIPKHPQPASIFALYGFNTMSGALLANATSQGLAIALMGVPYTGACPTVGVGTELCTVQTALLQPLTTLLQNYLPAHFQSQVQTDTQNKLAIALGVLIQQQTSLGSGQGTVTGASSTTGATGTSSGKLA